MTRNRSPRLALRHQRRAGRSGERDHAVGDPFDGGQRQLGEGGDLPEQTDDRLVDDADPFHAADAQEHRDRDHRQDQAADNHSALVPKIHRRAAPAGCR
jgi:hypothetical protein